MKKLIMVALGSTAFLLSACNTVQGMGEDIESVGECADGVEGNC
ncbi:entericidin A/B family lipoprotein [Qipengyuania sphaerica]|nr:entericidin A/B family lipoprotein [Qipengyuania sphaerica]MBX7540197.1 entericidin A/B family lipoprotein [Qipengyuania sphaerica]